MAPNRGAATDIARVADAQRRFDQAIERELGPADTGCPAALEKGEHRQVRASPRRAANGG